MLFIKNFKRILLIIIILNIIIVPFIKKMYAQNNDQTYKLEIKNINRDIKKKYFILPVSADITVNWQLSKYQNGQLVNCDNPDFSYKIFCLNFDDNNVPVDSSPPLNMNQPFVFENKKAGVEWGFYIKAFNGSQEVTVSDTCKTIIGKNSNKDDGNIFLGILVGKGPLYLLNKSQYYSKASLPGKFAFFILWLFIVSLFPFIFWFLPRLNYRRIFPSENGNNKFYKTDIDNILSNDFKDILSNWSEIISDSKKHINREIKEYLNLNIPNKTGNNKKEVFNNYLSISAIEGANTRFWAKEGKNRISELIARITRPKWKVIPTVKIFKAGLENHEINGYHWVEVSKEVDRAIENRAASEIEILKRKSHVDWLWNIGTMAPLVGLFGTATGISKVFEDIGTRTAVQQQGQQMINKLSAGINEALWTTIEGLGISLIFLFLYYFFNNKLKRIYMKWEDLYVNLSEKL